MTFYFRNYSNASELGHLGLWGNKRYIFDGEYLGSKVVYVIPRVSERFEV